jgi:fructose/tagatose bisphosphate aldolase
VAGEKQLKQVKVSRKCIAYKNLENRSLVMNDSKFLLAAIVAVVVLVSGCIGGGQDSEPASERAELVASVSQEPVTSNSTGRISLNARNLGEETGFYAEIHHLGDVDRLVDVKSVEGNSTNRIELGTAVMNGTTGKTFAEVERQLELNATASFNVKLYVQGNAAAVDSERINVEVSAE